MNCTNNLSYIFLILAIIAEEFGIITVFLIILALIFIAIRVFSNSQRMADKFKKTSLIGLISEYFSFGLRYLKSVLSRSKQSLSLLKGILETFLLMSSGVPKQIPSPTLNLFILNCFFNRSLYAVIK